MRKATATRRQVKRAAAASDSKHKQIISLLKSIKTKLGVKRG